MPDLTVSANVDTLMQAANFAAFRTSLGLTALATTAPGTGIATALAVNVGSAGAPILFNGAGGTPSSMVGTNITGTAAGLTAGVASAVAVGGISGLGTGVGTFLATPSGANLATALTTALPATKGGTGLTALGTGVATALGVNANAGGGLIALADPGADRVLFWDDSAGAYTFLTMGTGLTITGTTLDASGGTNAVTAASNAAGAGLLWVSDGADRSATATDTVDTINATNANVSNFLPVSNDGAAIGASGTAFSDVFLASGAVINFNAGNYTLTHSAGVLTANLDLRVTTPGTNAASVVTTAGAQTLSIKDFLYTVEPGADDTSYGDKLAGILAGDTIAQWDLVYLDSTSGRWELADSDAVATGGGVLLGLAVTSGTDGNALTVLLRGIVRNDGWTWASAGLKLYSSGTPGALTATQPSGTDDVIRPIADTLSDDCIWFAPGQFWQTHT